LPLTGSRCLVNLRSKTGHSQGGGMAMRAILKARAGCIGAVLLLMFSLVAGCASETKTVKRETVQYPIASSQDAPGPVVERQTTETTTETKREPHGVISSGVHFVGEVIAFPFRLIGAAFSALF
jgi:hypothetical protein